MSTIVLSRHGRPAWDYRTPISGRAFADWRRGEDNAPLDPSSQPGVDLAQVVRGASCVITSTLRRSLDSARLLTPTTALVTDEIFREAELPCSFHTEIRLRPDLWAVLARLAWFCGWSDGMESFAVARERSKRAAQFLIARAETHDSVVVVGHGMINVLIARHLRSRGWHGPRIPARRHWSFGVYSR